MRPEGSSPSVIHCDLNDSLRNSAGIIADKYAGSRLRLPIVEKTAKPCPSLAQTLQCRATGIRLPATNEVQRLNSISNPSGGIMRLSVLLLAFCIAPGLLVAAQQTTQPWPPVATFSILGFDPDTGEVGGAVQSRVFSVGNGVLWAEADVGAVATQAIVDV